MVETEMLEMNRKGYLLTASGRWSLLKAREGPTPSEREAAAVRDRDQARKEAAAARAEATAAREEEAAVRAELATVVKERDEARREKGAVRAKLALETPPSCADVAPCANGGDSCNATIFRTVGRLALGKIGVEQERQAFLVKIERRNVARRYQARPSDTLRQSACSAGFARLLCSLQAEFREVFQVQVLQPPFAHDARWSRVEIRSRNRA
jgi:hypothetical protein